VASYDGNSRVYLDALRDIQRGWGDPAKMADAIWPVLCNWHAEFYHWGSGDLTAIASAIKQKIDVINGFRSRTIDTLSKADEPRIRELFWEFRKATGRTNSKGFSASSTGAAKAMNILCPHFLPLWDEDIANLYRCEHDAFGYAAEFCHLMKEFAATAQTYVAKPDDRPILRRIDEYNWAITRRKKAS
jgi:hypothetical protein